MFGGYLLFKTKDYSEWSILTYLNYISSNADVNIKSILEYMKKKLQSISDQWNNLARARQKALTIYYTFDKSLERPKIQNVLHDKEGNW